MDDKDKRQSTSEDDFWIFDDDTADGNTDIGENISENSQRRKGSGKKPKSGSTKGKSHRSHSGSSKKKSHSSGRKTSKKKGRSNETLLHYIIIGAIALFAVIAAVRLIVWNIGKDSGYDPNADSSEYETEALDYIQPLDAELLEGREDDGVTTIVCLGNEPFTDETGKNGLAEMIARKCDATVYNCAFPGSYISMKNQDYTDSYPQDGLSLYLVTASLCGSDYTLMEHAAGLLPEGKDAAMESLGTLRSVDFDKVDMIVIMYDLHDYMDERPVMDVNNDINLLTWNGALNASLQLIQQTYPHIRLVVLSPTYGQFENSEGELINSDIVDFGNGVLPDYVLHEIDVAIYNGVSILDNYYGTINENMADTCLTDGYHLTQEGRERIAARFAKEIFYIK